MRLTKARVPVEYYGYYMRKAYIREIYYTPRSKRGVVIYYKEPVEAKDNCCMGKIIDFYV
jgi:hypothetical protein